MMCVMICSTCRVLSCLIALVAALSSSWCMLMGAWRRCVGLKKDLGK
jgi:hypothetical protein